MREAATLAGTWGSSLVQGNLPAGFRGEGVAVMRPSYPTKVRAREWDAIVQEVALKVQVLNYYMKRLNE